MLEVCVLNKGNESDPRLTRANDRYNSELSNT